MGLDLDARQRAMLAEMKVPVWWPETTPRTDAVPTPVEPAPVAPENRANNQYQERTQGQNDPENTTEHVVPPPRPVHAAAAVARTPRPEGIGQMDWSALKDTVAGCQACKLCERRRNTVFGVGDPAAEWMFVGEAPGENEDLQGEPFVGQAGHLLDNMLKAIGLSRSAAPAGSGGESGGEGVPPGLRSAYIANVIKCRPPGNRNPEPGEVAQCEPFLARQIALVRPRIIVAMGRFAATTLLAEAVPGVLSVPLGKLRGQVYRYQGVPVVVTYHPAYLLRNLPDKAKAWADLCLALEVAEGAQRSG